MIYFVGAIAVVFLGTGTLLAIWVARLKDEVGTWSARAADLALELQAARAKGTAADIEAKRLRLQLEAVRSEHEKVVSKVESGELSDADGLAAALRGLHKDDDRS